MRLTSAERERLTRYLLARVGAEALAADRAASAAEVRALVAAMSADDARQVCEQIETGRRARQLYERFRSYYEASRRVAQHLREMDRDLVELARHSELFRPEACEDIALFYAALERAQGDCSRAGIAAAAPADAGAELAFIRYLTRTLPEANQGTAASL